MGFASELFEFIWTVYDDLGLVHASNRLHPRTQGWLKLFKRWFEVDVVRGVWVNATRSRIRTGSSRSSRRTSSKRRRRIRRRPG